MRALRNVPLVASGVLACSLLLGCKQAAPWGAEGTEDEPCFPDQTCDPGLVCSPAGFCVSEPVPPAAEAGPRRDRGTAPRLDSRRPGESGLPDAPPPNCSSVPPQPSVTSYPQTTSFPKAAVKGIAPGAVKVQVTGAAAPQSAPVAGGIFCIEVSLFPGINHLQLVSVDGKGCSSSPVFIDIQLAAEGPVNIAHGLLASTKRQPDAGLVSYLSDGQLSTVARFSFWDTTSACDEREHIWYDLGSLRSIDQVNVRYPKKGNFKSYMVCWDLLISGQVSPADPDPKHPDWTLVQGSTSDTYADVTIKLGGTQARHVALLMYEDASTSYQETFELAEVEVWGSGLATTCP